MREEALLKAAKIVGSQITLAKVLGVNDKTLNNWVNLGVRIPVDIAMDIEVIVSGQIIAENISPHKAESLKRYKEFKKSEWWNDVVMRTQKIKQECLKNKKLIEAEVTLQLPLQHAILGLLTCCDGEGRFFWSPQELKLDIFPASEEVKFELILNVLSTLGLIKKCVVRGQCYGSFSCMQNQKEELSTEKGLMAPAQMIF